MEGTHLSSRLRMVRVFEGGYYEALMEAIDRFPDAFWYLGTWEAMTNPGEIIDVCRWMSENNGERGEVFLPITRRTMPWLTTVEMMAILQAYPSSDDLFNVLPPMTGISAHRYLPDTISEIDLCIWAYHDYWSSSPMLSIQGTSKRDFIEWMNKYGCYVVVAFGEFAGWLLPENES